MYKKNTFIEHNLLFWCINDYGHISSSYIVFKKMVFKKNKNVKQTAISIVCFKTSDKS